MRVANWTTASVVSRAMAQGCHGRPWEANVGPQPAPSSKAGDPQENVPTFGHADT
jgi:hypothetical protein